MAKNKQPTKRMVGVPIMLELSEYTGDIVDVINYFKFIENAYLNSKVYIEFDGNELTAFYNREETDAEFNERVAFDKYMEDQAAKRKMVAQRRSNVEKQISDKIKEIDKLRKEISVFSYDNF